MTLHEDVTFDSLSAVKEEIRQWLGPESISSPHAPKNSSARDALVGVLIHSLADELSDVRVRSQIHALLADLPKRVGEPLAD